MQTDNDLQNSREKASLSYYITNPDSVVPIVTFMDKSFKLTGIGEVRYREDSRLKSFLTLIETKFARHPAELRYLIHKYGTIFDLQLVGIPEEYNVKHDLVMDITCKVQSILFGITIDDLVIQTVYELDVLSFNEPYPFTAIETEKYHERDS